MKKLLLFISMILMIVGIGFALGGSESQSMGEKEQESIMMKARMAYPTPEVKEFLTRKYVIKWMKRMDQPGKIFYIYVIADTGTITHYFVAQYRPISTATFLTPTQREIDVYGDNVLGPAPALDGTYYGNGGASEQYFFFDAETDAFIELKGLNYIVSDQPFDIKAPRITITKEN